MTWVLGVKREILSRSESPDGSTTEPMHHSDLQSLLLDSEFGGKACSEHFNFGRHQDIEAFLHPVPEKHGLGRDLSPRPAWGPVVMDSLAESRLTLLMLLLVSFGQCQTFHLWT
mmetsp:Transcript_55168/g.98454  ORF Transcript_55168/g.98454 Transcript_55168/m.98454 type:complete len:114 (-) Transcript_55168:123-464(-)